jgi:hypothetical protein
VALEVVEHPAKSRLQIPTIIKLATLGLRRIFIFSPRGLGFFHLNLSGFNMQVISFHLLYVPFWQQLVVGCFPKNAKCSRFQLTSNATIVKARPLECKDSQNFNRID